MNTELIISPDIETLSSRAAELVAGYAAEAVKMRGRFTLALAGGGTPRGLYETLASPAFRDRVPWESCLLFWGDERCVPPDDPESNYSLARRALLSKVPVVPDNVFRMPGEKEKPEIAARAYEEVLRARFPTPHPDGTAVSGGPAFPRFDLALLGMGDDGHTASLFPGSPVLDEKVRWVRHAAAPAGYPTRDRLTLTLPVLNAAARVMFLVTGVGKRKTLRRVFDTAPPGDPRLPASLVRPADGELIWLLDHAVAPE